ncbi:hypothetical protein JMN32_24990 [Fulvivirga sp. 29W222]|uniref:Uncharacterized protein n=1 Tax=Fulvivirga marina TaxID=2494733 RepID=A0A937G709_9BACT|nr:hypothetical protein [Fulvivirga marina]MBL6449591.1 hypothetical protein [Fulvivirga marina]
MKTPIVKISFVAAFLFAFAFFGNSQLGLANLSDNADLTCVEEMNCEILLTEADIVCTSWSKVGTGSRCTAEYQGQCICYEYYDVERRVCGIPASSWQWEEFRETNHRTAGC